MLLPYGERGEGGSYLCNLGGSISMYTRVVTLGPAAPQVHRERHQKLRCLRQVELTKCKVADLEDERWGRGVCMYI